MLPFQAHPNWLCGEQCPDFACAIANNQTWSADEHVGTVSWWVCSNMRVINDEFPWRQMQWEMMWINVIPLKEFAKYFCCLVVVNVVLCPQIQVMMLLGFVLVPVNMLNSPFPPCVSRELSSTVGHIAMRCCCSELTMWLELMDSLLAIAPHDKSLTRNNFWHHKDKCSKSWSGESGGCTSRTDDDDAQTRASLECSRMHSGIPIITSKLAHDIADPQ